MIRDANQRVQPRLTTGQLPLPKFSNNFESTKDVFSCKEQQVFCPTPHPKISAGCDPGATSIAGIVPAFQYIVVFFV